MRPARRALGPVPFRRQRSPARAAARSRVHLDVGGLRRRTPRVQPAARVRCLVRDPDLPTTRVRRRDAVPAPRCRRRAGAAGAARGRRSERPDSRRSRVRPDVSSRAPVAAARTCAARFSAAARSAGPRSPHLELRSAEPEGADFVARVAAQEGVELRVADRGRTRSPTRRAPTRSPACSPSPARARPCSCSRRAQSCLRRARAPTGSRTPTTRTSSGRAARRTSSCAQSQRLRRTGDFADLPPQLQEIGELRERHPTLSLRELALTCRPPTTKAAAHRRLQKLQQTCSHLTFAPCCRLLDPFVILKSGGSALVRRRIQTPSDATVLSVVQPEGEVVLGASPLARRCAERAAAGHRAEDGRAGRAGTASRSTSQSDVDVARRSPEAGHSGGRRPPGQARTASSVDSASAVDVARHRAAPAGGGRGPPLTTPAVPWLKSRPPLDSPHG